MDVRPGAARAAILAYAILFLAAFDANAQFGVPFARYRTFETEHFILTFEAGLEAYARRAAARAEAAHPRLARAYGSTPRGKIRLVSVSFDPDVDTPAVLRAHAARRKADPAVWTFLTGDRLTVERFAARFGVSVMRSPPESKEITHNLRTALISLEGRILKLYSGSEWTPTTMLADLRAAVREQ
jgi:hypothetical protein